MNTYRIIITYKDRKFTTIEGDGDDTIREILQKDLQNRKEEWLRIGDYFICKNDILHIRIEGEPTLEKHIRKELQNKGKKKQ